VDVFVVFGSRAITYQCPEPCAGIRRVMTTRVWRTTRTVEAYTIMSLVQPSQEQSPRATASDLHIHVVSVLCIGLASWSHTWPLDKGPNSHVVDSVSRPSFGSRLNVGALMFRGCAERIVIPFVISPAESQRAQDILNRYMPQRLTVESTAETYIRLHTAQVMRRSLQIQVQTTIRLPSHWQAECDWIVLPPNKPVLDNIISSIEYFE
jgi:hypothetical protein